MFVFMQFHVSRSINLFLEILFIKGPVYAVYIVFFNIYFISSTYDEGEAYLPFIEETWYGSERNYIS